MAALCAGAAQAQVAFQIVPSPCPANMEYLTFAEAQAQAAAICAQIGEWAIVEVGAHSTAGVSGSGYACNVNPSSCAASCTESVCKMKGTGAGPDGEIAEGVAVWAILTFTLLSLYVGGGVIYQYHTHKTVTHPHVAHWKNITGLVTDGFHFTKAKYAGEEYKGSYEPVPDADDQGAQPGGAAQPGFNAALRGNAPTTRAGPAARARPAPARPKPHIEEEEEFDEEVWSGIADTLV